QKQLPWESSSPTHPYCCVPPSASPQPLALPGPTVNQPESAPQIASVDPKQLDLTYWTSIQNSTDPADFQAYLDQFPNGVYAKLAANRLKALGNTAVQTAEKDRTVPEQAPSTTAGTLVFSAVDQVVFTKDKAT